MNAPPFLQAMLAQWTLADTANLTLQFNAFSQVDNSGDAAHITLQSQ